MDSALAVGVPGLGRSGLGPSSCPYSPECVEEEFCEIAHSYVTMAPYSWWKGWPAWEAGRKGGSTRHAHLRSPDELDRPRSKVRQGHRAAARPSRCTRPEAWGECIEQVYWTVGPYDLVTILQAPDDESLAAMLLELGTGGNLRTTTLRAYDREEMSGIIQRLD
jgi:uncharacterized protein with GYD domain